MIASKRPLKVVPLCQICALVFPLHFIVCISFFWWNRKLIFKVTKSQSIYTGSITASAYLFFLYLHILEATLSSIYAKLGDQHKRHKPYKGIRDQLLALGGLILYHITLAFCRKFSYFSFHANVPYWKHGNFKYRWTLFEFLWTTWYISKKQRKHKWSALLLSPLLL